MHHVLKRRLGKFSNSLLLQILFILPELLHFDTRHGLVVEHSILLHLIVLYLNIFDVASR